MMKKMLLTAAVLANAALLCSCSGTLNTAGASSLEISANGYVISINAGTGNKEYDNFVEATSGVLHKASLDDCHFGDIKLTFVIDGEETVLYPCCDDDCKYIAVGNCVDGKYEYIEVTSEERKLIFDFLDTYAQ